ncbi:MAG: AarF/ABC1/UbiB kinase family protein [Anaerolineaceae bacterium]|nr:AarF/ABC1/UbiB kinase family protein [Anaerolineaceae bacterium]
MIWSRYSRILWYFGRVILNIFIWDVTLSQLGFRKQARKNRSVRFRKAAEGFRSLAVDMGGVMIKVGQFLSSRLDVLPPEITEELSGLQDEVQPENYEDIQKIIEAEYGRPVSQVFDFFEVKPTAAASIGQVHKAHIRQKNNEQENPIISNVVIKIQRPNIEAIINTDLSALRIVTNVLNRYKPIRKFVDVHSLLSELSRSIHEEMDYLLEGKYAQTFAENLKADDDIVVPEVIWSHTTKRVIVLEDVSGIKITDYAAIEAAGLDRKEIAERLFDSYLTQIFDHHFFHADPHPGNLFVLPGDVDPENGKRNWKLVFVDFGMMGHVPGTLLAGLREIIIAIGTRDTDRLIKGYQIMDILLPEADLDLIKKSEERMFEEFWGKTAPEMMQMSHEVAMEFAQEFSELIFDMPFQVPENFILLGRCLSILSGMCTGLDESFNIWTSIVPYTQKLVKEEGGINWKYWAGELGDSVRAAVFLPKRAEALIDRIEQRGLEIRSPELKSGVTRLERAFTRVVWSILFTALFLGGIQLYLASEMVLAGISGGLGLLILLFGVLLR